MSTQGKEFFIIGVVEGQHCWAIGRCGDLPVRVGDVFDALYKYEPPASLDAYAHKANRSNGEIHVALRVEAIQAYGREIDHLSPGMTGTLVLSGAGGQQLEADMVLGPAQSHDAGHSCAVADAKRT